MSNLALWGIDLGGTKIEGVVLKSAVNPTVVARKRVPTEAVNGYDHILNQIKLLVDQLIAEVGYEPLTIGIGTPGTLDPATKLQKNSNTTCLNGKPLKADLEKLLGVPVFLANDANCFALAEDRMGIVREVVKDPKLTFGIIMGTGVGGGLVIDGHVRNGIHGIGGEWGHNFLDDSGGPCYCGLEGCVETIISGPALERHYHQVSGQQMKLAEILKRHEANSDTHATETIERLLHFFGKAVASLVNILDPDAIVIGGGVGNIDLLYTEGRKHILKHVFNPEFQTPILKPKLGDSAGVFGAAYLTT